MSHDPGHPDDGEAGVSNRKTRLVMRPGTAEDDGPSGRSAEGVGTPASGVVIGTTRLVGNPGQASGAMSSEGATVRMQSQGKTRSVREGSTEIDPVAGWIVVVKGPGRGGFRPVFVGMNSVGRGADQRIRLDFGDETISRKEHAFITYDDETRTFYLQHGGKANLVRIAGKPVLQPMELKPFDMFSIGHTVLRFIANCGPGFCWSSEVDDE